MANESDMLKFRFKALLKDKALGVSDLARDLDMPYTTVRDMVRRGTVKPATYRKLTRIYKDAPRYYSYHVSGKKKK